MTITFADGFEDSAEADYPGASSSLSAGNGRRGGKALSLTSSSAVEIFPGPGTSTCFVHVALNPNSRTGVFLQFTEAGFTHVYLQNNVDGSISAYMATSATLLGTSAAGVLPSSGYTSIQVKVVIHDSTGSVEVRLNGSSSPVLNLTNKDTKNGMSGVAVSVTLGASTSSIGNSSTPPYFDDFVIWDTTGSVNNTWLGDLRVDSYLPTADGDTTTMTTSTGSTHYTLVDEVPASGTDYVQSKTAGNKDLYQMGDMTNTPATVNAVLVVANLLKDDAGNREMALLVKSGGTESDGPNFAPGTSTQKYVRVLETDPNGSVAWTKSAVDALQVGVKIVI